MKARSRYLLIALAWLALATLGSQVSTAFAQGSLTPPGAPAPTMKSLDQIEPRTPVDAVHTPGVSLFMFYINQPGSYYLTTNIVGVSGKDGIGIAGNNVTLDLNGFTLLGGSGTEEGIYIYNTCTNITVRNGNVSGWSTGFGRGIDSQGNNVTLEHLTVFANGIGMQCLNSLVVRDCTISENNIFGIELNCSDSLVIGNKLVSNNVANMPGDGAIYITGSNNRIENNHVTESGPAGNGILVFNSSSITNNIVIKNSVEGGGANNYSINTNYNDVGPIGSASTNTSPWGNISH
jgi:hypothetical protein